MDINVLEKETPVNYEQLVAPTILLANSVLIEYGLEPINTGQLRILSPDEYTKLVTDTKDDYALTPEVAEAQLKGLARGSAGIVLPGGKEILYTTDAIDIQMGNPNDPNKALLAGAFAHENYHLQAMLNRREFDNLEEIPVYDQLINYYKKYPELSFILVGPGLEVRSRGKIVALQVRFGEFLADIQRYFVIGRHFDLNDLVGNIADYHCIYSKHKKIFPQAIVSDFRTFELSHLCGLLCASWMSKEGLVAGLKSSYTDPIGFLRQNPFGHTLTEYFAHGENEREVILDILKRSKGKQSLSDTSIDIIGQLIYENDFGNLVKKSLP